MSEAFECRMCGHCCEGSGGIILTAKDQTRLAAYLEIRVEDLLNRYAEVQDGGKYGIITGDDNYCVFFRQGKGCTVHPGRPDVCRAWPFFRGNLVDAVAWEMVQEDCPGINADVPHAEFARQGREYLTELDLLHEEENAPRALVPDQK